MTTSSPPSPPDLIHFAVDDEQPTAALDSTLAPRPDVLAVLDHRHRRRAVDRRLALPGDHIEVTGGDGESMLVPLEGKVIHVGRSIGSDLRFDDAHVSRRHAIIVRYGRHVRILDDRSTAGTFVNGVRVIATDLSDGDVVALGPVAFTFAVVS